MTSGEEGREARKLRIGVSGNMEKTLGRVGWHGVFWIFFHSAVLCSENVACAEDLRRLSLGK